MLVIIGSVIVMVSVMGGFMIAALVGTFLGILVSYVFFSPLAAAMVFNGHAVDVALRQPSPFKPRCNPSVGWSELEMFSLENRRNESLSTHPC